MNKDKHKMKCKKKTQFIFRIWGTYLYISYKHKFTPETLSAFIHSNIQTFSPQDNQRQTWQRVWMWVMGGWSCPLSGRLSKHRDVSCPANHWHYTHTHTHTLWVPFDPFVFSGISKEILLIFTGRCTFVSLLTLFRNHLRLQQLIH